jgi:hypothetical protein
MFGFSYHMQRESRPPALCIISIFHVQSLSLAIRTLRLPAQSNPAAQNATMFAAPVFVALTCTMANTQVRCVLHS